MMFPITPSEDHFRGVYATEPVVSVKGTALKKFGEVLVVGMVRGIEIMAEVPAYIDQKDNLYVGLNNLRSQLWLEWQSVAL